jgi:hypothetical protein
MIRTEKVHDQSLRFENCQHTSPTINPPAQNVFHNIHQLQHATQSRFSITMTNLQISDIIPTILSIAKFCTLVFKHNPT